ncbi:MAG: hypothetical protein LBS24_07540 [Clostridiales Family XIII bacterium]|jgi:DNA-directed RNA polymerase specialized sigma24 family protein|nr:hypothetical protein [Clostridiales Family XIII bacterium]
MTAKEELKKIRKMNYLINQMHETVDVLRARLLGSRSVPDDVRVQNSLKHPDPAADRLAKIIDLENMINESIDYSVDLKRDAMATIMKMQNEDQKSILIARYFNGRKWDEIAEDMSYHVQRVYQIHGEALISYGANRWK